MVIESTQGLIKRKKPTKSISSHIDQIGKDNKEFSYCMATETGQEKRLGKKEKKQPVNFVFKLHLEEEFSYANSFS